MEGGTARHERFADGVDGSHGSPGKDDNILFVIPRGGFNRQILCRHFAHELFGEHRAAVWKEILGGNEDNQRVSLGAAGGFCRFEGGDASADDENLFHVDVSFFVYCVYLLQGESPLRRRPKGNENRRTSAIALWKPSVPLRMLLDSYWKFFSLCTFRSSNKHNHIVTWECAAKGSRGRSQSPLVASAEAKPLAIKVYAALLITETKQRKKIRTSPQFRRFRPHQSLRRREPSAAPAWR